MTARTAGASHAVSATTPAAARPGIHGTIKGAPPPDEPPVHDDEGFAQVGHDDGVHRPVMRPR